MLAMVLAAAIEIRLEAPQPRGVIVEFHAAGTRAATLERFRRDVSARRLENSAGGAIRHEYVRCGSRCAGGDD
jgi:hypothetical protein